jgi:ATP-binding cassette, subfamily C, bacterial CydC
MSVARTLRELISLAPARPVRVTLAIVLGALTTLFGVGLMAAAGYLICRAAQRPAVLSLMVTIVAVRFFGLGRPVLRYCERLMSHDVALRSLGPARSRVYEKLEPLAPAQLVAFRQGDLLTRLVADVDGLQNLYLRVIEPPFVAVVASAVAVGAAAAFLPSAAIVLGVGLLVGGVLVPAVSALVGRRAARREARARGELTSELIELLGGAAELLVLGAESERLARLRRADRTLVRLARRDALASGLGDGLGLLVSGLTVAGVLLVAVTGARQGTLDTVLIAMLSLLALASFEGVVPLVGAAREVSTTLASGRRITALTDTEPAVLDPAGPLPAPRWPFTIAFEAVTAGYNGQRKPALAHFSLTLNPGERVALLGASGAGKTTVVNLLLRFLDPSSGRITLDGDDLRGFNQSEVRSTIALAGQEAHLFSTSIANNLRLARPQASDSELETALRRARIWDWVNGLPDRMDTRVGEDGRELSGGQRQRIVLARALLQDAPVLVLDEPTAHLDATTADQLMSDLFAEARGRTVLLITHRTEGLQFVDRAVSLDAANPTLAGPGTAMVQDDRGRGG